MTAAAGPLQTRVARLEQIVSGLQGQAGGGEALSPNYLTLGPDGEVGANFTGLINALGLVLPEFQGGVSTAANEITWVRQSDGAVVAHVEGGHLGTDEAQLNLTADGTHTGDTLGAQIALKATSSFGLAELNVQSAFPAPGSVNVSATMPNAGVFFMIADDGTSSFAQLPVPAELFIDGPHQLAVPAFGAGGLTGLAFTTTRAAWTTGIVIGGTAYAGSGGLVFCSGGNYTGGNGWNANFGSVSASAACAGLVYVVGR